MSWYKILIDKPLLKYFFLCLFTMKPLSSYGFEALDLYSLSLEQLTKIEISTGTKVSIKEAPSSATLISAEDIEAMGALTLVDVLESVPGLHVIPSTLNRMRPVYTIRGIYAGQNSQVMFMLNGHRIDGDLYAAGLGHMNQLNLKAIARIEVVTGPGSAIYGADAYAGVVNIITKSAQQLDGVNVGLRLGSNHTRNAWLGYGGSFDNGWQLAVNAEYYKINSDKDRIVSSDFQSTLDELFGSQASIAPTYLEDRVEALNYNIHLSNDYWSLGLDGYQKKGAGVGAGAAQAIDHSGYDSYESYLISLSYTTADWINEWRITSELSYFYNDSEPHFTIFPAGAVLPVGNDGNVFTPHDGIGCQTVNIPSIGCLTSFNEGYLGNPGNVSKVPTFTLSAYYQQEEYDLRFSAGVREERIYGDETKNFGPGVLDKATLAGRANPAVVDGRLTSVENTPYNFIPAKSRTNRFISAQSVWQLNDSVTLTSGIRYDHYSDVGSTINPRFAFVWQPSEQLTTKLLYGEAFRAPSFSELYAQNNPIAIGNSSVKPEKIKTTELVFDYQWSRNLQSMFNFYYFSSKDMIEFKADESGVGKAQNLYELKGHGIDLSTHWYINANWHLQANFSWQRTENDGMQIEFVPQKQLYFDSRWQLTKQWLLSTQISYIADRERALTDLRDDIDNYYFINLNLLNNNIRLNNSQGHWELTVSIKNLLDQKIYEPSDGRIADDYPLHGRRLYLQLNYQF